jgi:hypothetical protein
VSKYYTELFACFPDSSTETSVSEASYLKSFNNQFSLSAEKVEDTFDVVQGNFTLYLMSYGRVNVNDNSLIDGSRLAICATGFSMSSATLTTYGRGCEQD